MGDEYVSVEHLFLSRKFDSCIVKKSLRALE
jgi:hypothetical protein